jgi:prepilin-type N-terminal cleavage/methylation domain-containing protein/prepilin-type processing-associated H-X9-DG protein
MFFHFSTHPLNDLKRCRPSWRMRRGFTLPEMLVVIAIIAILGFILFSAAQKMIASGKTAKATANLRQIGALMASYTADNNNCLPVLVHWDNYDKTWWQRVLSESAGLPVKDPGKDLERRLVDCFYDPALGKGTHPYGDFGGNQAIMVDYNPWDPASAANKTGPRLASIGTPSKKVLVASAKIPSGVPCKGSWYFQGREWAAAGTAEAMPDARHGGKALCLFADGHTEALDVIKMDSAERRKYFLRD